MKQVLYVIEDSPDDYEAICDSLSRAGVGYEKIQHFSTGEELLAYLEVPGLQRIVPAAILMDIQLPAISGLALLERIRRDPTLRLVPVIMISSSAAPAEVTKAYHSGANSYLRKPTSLDDFEVMMRRFKAFWLDTAISPIT